MLLDRWIPAKYFVKQEICAVELCAGAEEKVCHYLHLRSRNKQLALLETGSVKALGELPKAILKNKIPLVLLINGKGIILKKVELQEGQDLEEILQQHLPAVNTVDFYVQLYRQQDQTGFIALCRKQMVDEVLSEISAGKWELADVLLGAPAVLGLQPLWGNLDSIFTSQHLAVLSNNTLEALSPAEPPAEAVQLEGLHFNATCTLSFAGGLSYLTRHTLAETNSPELFKWKQQHVEKNKFRFLLMFSVGFAFLLAVVNVLFYTAYFDKNNKLETELAVYQGKYDQVSQLITDYQKNKDLIENAGVLAANKLSEYADRIGKTLPEEVVLSDLHFNPRNEDEESEDSLVTFRVKDLVIKGHCPKSFIVNEWINVLKMQKFIKDVSLERFEYTSQGLLPNFEIKLVTD